MALISQAVLGKAAVAVGGMGLNERAALGDEVFAHQPNLLASILVLQRMGATLEQMEVPLHVLLVAYQAMKSSAHVWPLICEDDQDACLQRLTGTMRFGEGLSPRLHSDLIQQYINEHREPYLLAFTYGHLREHDLLGARTEAQKFLLLASLNLVECIANAAARMTGAPSSR